MMKTWLKHILTGKDNQTYDLIKSSILAAVLLGVIGAIIELIKYHDIPWMSIASYFATILGIGSAGIKIKETTEPGQ